MKIAPISLLNRGLKMKSHGNLGNKNAQHDEQLRDVYLQVRLGKTKKDFYLKEAQKANMNLTKWIFFKLDAK